jgi:hypothetical protein
MKRSAQRRILRARKAKRGTGSPIQKFLLPLLLIIAFFVFMKVSTKYWNNHDKFAFTYRLTNGDAGVMVMDPVLSEMTTIVIPGDTEVNVAQNYGTMRIKNVWQLGVNEKLFGKLLAATVTKNFLFPVFLWSDSDAESLGKGNLGGIIKFIFLPQKTNIPLGDRVEIGIFALKVNGLKTNEINLGKSQFLHKEKLNDGTLGYRLIGPVPQALTVYFSDNDFADKNLRVAITDATGQVQVSEKVGEILEVMGGKIVAIDRVAKNDNLDCQILGSDSKIARKIANLFSCKIEKEKGSYDLEIRLGAKFLKRF